MADVIRRINDYLGCGGLFNPELMEHQKVSDLIKDARDSFSEAHELTEKMYEAIDLLTGYIDRMPTKKHETVKATFAEATAFLAKEGK